LNSLLKSNFRLKFDKWNVSDCNLHFYYTDLYELVLVGMEHHLFKIAR